MDGETSTSRHDVGLLERVVLDGNAEPTYVPLSLLEDITNCFSDDHRIGSGGFAVVYKGIVGKGVVAVKKLSKTSYLPETKFHREIECLMKAKHKNIVRFLGYCSEVHGRIADHEGKFVMSDIRNWLLCFEYVPNGSLDKYITDASHGLEWRKRYEIIKGICEGLFHLHEKRILHLDLKPCNILLDKHMVPKITDFGLSKCLDEDQTRAFTLNLCGSLGYLPPEFFRGQLGFASDIYSLGVIIVEILTGEKGYPEDENVVENWMNRLEGSDERDVLLEQVRVCTKIGMECMDSDPKKRPDASHIIVRLEKTSNTVKTGIGSSSVEQQVSFLKDHSCQGKIANLSPEYLEKDIKERAETEEFEEYVGTLREDCWQQGQEEDLCDQRSLQGAEDTKQNFSPQGASISGSNSGVLDKLKNLNIFNRKKNRTYYERNGGPRLESAETIKIFKIEEVKPFLKSSYLILKDGFGEVYKGLVDNVPVTLRKLTGAAAHREHDSFVDEVIIQARMGVHKNILRLIGCCLECENPILVYEFSEKNLQDLLHSNYKMPLNLGARLSIAADSAHGLAFMHSVNSIPILHSDFKPANIVFDDNFVPKVSNFGMSRMIDRDYGDTGIINGMAYIDPVYMQTGLLTEKSDVYSFGVVILELLTRKKATHSDNNSLVRNFHDNHKMGRKSTELFDKEIAVTGDLELLDNLAEIAMECLNLDVNLRPRMIDVAERLSILHRSCKMSHLQAS